MCGIAGYCSTKNLNGVAMLRAIAHRGPDNQSEWSTEIGEATLWMGHSRLSIIDLSVQANQPMWSDDAKVALIYNGELYNFRELKVRFLSDCTFRTTSDTEVLMRLYLKLGLDFVQHLNGDFALAIYDFRTGQIHLIRDRLGVKPLYYLLRNGNLVFASVLEALKISGEPLSLNTEMLMPYLAFKYVPGNNTLWSGAKRLPPAHILTYTIENHTASLSCYWALSEKQPIESYSKAREQLFALLEDAVQLRLVADVPVGNFLSGGLDSSVIAYFLRNNSQISHYCAVKSADDLRKEGSSSDFYYAERLARDWNLSVKPIPIGSENLDVESIRRTLRFSDDLIADGSQIPSYLITEQAGKYARVILSGMGADELFWGYAGHGLIWLSQRFEQLPKAFAEPLLKYLASLNQGKGMFKPFKRFLYKLGKYQQRPESYNKALLTLVGDFDNSTSVLNASAEWTLDFMSGYFSNNRPLADQLMQFELDNFLVKNLHYTDRIAMANAMETRVPYLDHRVVELAYSMPPEYKISAFGTTKRVLKDAFRGYVPDYVINRRKAGFGMPLRSIFSRADELDKLFDMEYLSTIAPFNRNEIQQHIKAHLSGQQDNSQLIYALISLQHWHQINF